VQRWPGSNTDTVDGCRRAEVILSTALWQRDISQINDHALFEGGGGVEVGMALVGRRLMED